MQQPVVLWQLPQSQVLNASGMFVFVVWQLVQLVVTRLGPHHQTRTRLVLRGAVDRGFKAHLAIRTVMAWAAWAKTTAFCVQKDIGSQTVQCLNGT